MYTIGHSNHSSPDFINLLKRQEIELVIDVRSAPYSKYVPIYSKSSLEALLNGNYIKYDYMGDRLGGKPSREDVQDDEGNVDYNLIRSKSWFQEAIDELLRKAKEQKTAILCAEEDPNRCHRELLVSKTVRERGFDVYHIRKNGVERGDQSLDKYF